MKRTGAITINLDWLFLLALALMGWVIFCHRLGAPGLMDPDEGRYAEIAREMLSSGNWLIPQLNFLPYLEKPPLVYWLTAASFGALGQSELPARLVPALSALGGVFLAYWLGRVLWGPAAGFLGAVVLATSAGYMALGRILTLDMALALWLNLAVGLGYVALSRGRPKLWPWAYLALALAVLTKGPVALALAGLIWGLGVLIISPPPQPSPLKGEGVKGNLLTRPRLESQRPWRGLLRPWSWLLLAAVVLPWFVLVWRQYPEFFRFFILEQHFGRYLTAALHPRPFYYYGPVLLGLLLPWTLLLPWALLQGPGADRDRLFLMLWAAIILVFFSLSRGKLVPYILPALLPLALLLGRSLEGALARGRRQPLEGGLYLSLLVWALCGWALLGLYLASPPWLAGLKAQAALVSPQVPWLLAIFALAPTAVLLFRHPWLLFLGALMLSTLAPPALEQVAQRRSPRELGVLVRELWRPGAALVGVQRYSQGLSFYSGQPFHLLKTGSELDFGRELQPDSGFFWEKPSEMTAWAASRPLVFFFLKDERLPYLQGLLPGDYLLLGRYKDCVLVAYGGK